MIQVVRRSIVDVYNRYSFNRQSLAYDSKGRLYHLHNARFSEGKFGQAVLVEEGTTNLALNPLFSSTLNWSFSTNGGGTFSVSNNWGKIVKGTGIWDILRQKRTVTVNPGDTYTFSMTFKNNVSGQVGFRIGIIGQEESSSKYTLNGSGGTVRFSKTFTFTTTGSTLFFDVVLGTAFGQASSASVVEFTMAQCEKMPYPTSFIDGTRAGDNLSISPDVINLAEGEIELTVIPQIVPTSTGVNIHFEANAGKTAIQFLIYCSSGYWRVGLRDKHGTGFYHSLPYDGQEGIPTDIKLKWKNINSGQADAEVKAIINGVEIGYITGVQIDMNPLTVAYIGRRATNQTLYGNALYDDLRISSIYRSDEDDIAAYESNQPLPVDQYTTLKLGFDGPDGQRGAAIVTL